jgi:ubiquinol-cytochrome c reductase cytochrome b subunit
MSYWAATVITNFFSIIPFVGHYVTEFLWGGFTVSEVTLKRFFSLHFILGFLILVFVIIHIIVLHDKGSSSSKFENLNKKVNFLPFFGEEAFFTILSFFVLVIFFVFFRPNYFMHPSNYEQSNPLVTPLHIVPE